MYRITTFSGVAVREGALEALLDAFEAAYRLCARLQVWDSVSRSWKDVEESF